MRGKLEKISRDLTASKVEQVEDGGHVAGRELFPGREQSIEFVSKPRSRLHNFAIMLFSALGVQNVSISDIDTAHSVPSRSASDKPNAIVCKFVRRLAKGKVMAARRDVANVQASQLGFQERLDVRNIALYDHLTPRLQELLFQSKNFQRANGLKFCWAKNGFVYLRKTDSSPVLKLSNLEDLRELIGHS